MPGKSLPDLSIGLPGSDLLRQKRAADQQLGILLNLFKVLQKFIRNFYARRDVNTTTNGPRSLHPFIQTSQLSLDTENSKC
ncbi:hypothetical protein BDR06DRAFT_957484 [Suillus hirtellus]|nr:hypothetical protein BDR06DRAFT_957484 [Suillus hirtellus]